ncbi:MAG: aminotransferase class I/II-fold pyridoxal phosphate-dependent enzyme, partial [Hyphomicrobiaceae bacterium]
PFLRMNANSYLGLSFQTDIVAAEEVAVRSFGSGPGAVRFISGTWAPHVTLEERLARFHGREAAMIFSSAYATVIGILPALITNDTVVISDELNHNCIINAIRLAAPSRKSIYSHLSLDGLEHQLQAAVGQCRRAIIVTDGVFSMRGDHAPLDEIVELAHRYDGDFPENVIVVVDDSHGVGAFGKTGRGTEEITDSGGVDLLIGTLGKAFGVNGGYVVAAKSIINYMRETSAFYIYSNPITCGEAAAATRAIEIVDSPRGKALLSHLREMKSLFQIGLTDMNLETISGEHPVTPLMIRNSHETARLVDQLFDRGILATGLRYPVVPRGDEEIRFQISADHTSHDIEQVLDAIRASV